jgi:coproporphyrinogen III oxidase-like Fe-S oxidoreductase
MITEKFISQFMKYKTRDYLTFKELGTAKLPDTPGRKIQLYIHIPFCRVLCPYCSFHRVAFDETLAREYFKALRHELSLYRDKGFDFYEVYIGGGTPTILMDELSTTLKHISSIFSPQDISVETNPDMLNRDAISALSDMGAGRISVGVQTFQDNILKLIGRYDKYGSGDELKEKISKVIGIAKTLNIDMIYNYPVQTREDILSDIKILNDVNPDQITFYPLMISDRTRLTMKKIMGRQSLAKEHDFYSLITSGLASYKPVSAWCFSKSNAMIDEYVTSNEDYLGAGSGAFGLVNGSIYANTFSITSYIDSLNNSKLPVYAKKNFSKKELMRYMFLMGLFGLKMPRSSFINKFGNDPWKMLTLECLFFSLTGAIKTTHDDLVLTEKGRYLWVIMMKEFFTGVDNFRDLSRIEAGYIER